MRFRCAMRLLVCTPLFFVAVQTPDEAMLTIKESPSGPKVVAMLPLRIADELPKGRLTQSQGEKILTVSLLSSAKTPGPSILGTYDRSGRVLTFTPRFPLSPGASYRAVLKGETTV